MVAEACEISEYPEASGQRQIRVSDAGTAYSRYTAAIGWRGRRRKRRLKRCDDRAGMHSSRVHCRRPVDCTVHPGQRPFSQ